MKKSGKKFTAIEKESFLKKVKDKGWKPRGICREMDKTESWLSKILSGKRGMNCDDLIRISKITGIPPQELLSGYHPEKILKDDNHLIAEQLHEHLPREVMDILITLREKNRNKKGE